MVNGSFTSPCLIRGRTGTNVGYNGTKPVHGLLTASPHLPIVARWQVVIATAFDISQHHLVKVVHNLSKLGYLDTFRGRGGGITLGKAPEAIGIGELVRATESTAVVECLRPGKGTCCINGVCELKSVLRGAVTAFLAELDKVTLADLLKQKQAMRQRFRKSRAKILGKRLKSHLTEYVY